MRLPATKLYHDVTATGDLKGIALEVFQILCLSPGLTAGEVFLRYQAKFPDTDRNRNELAKRISDLAGWGVVKASGRALCPTSGKMVTTWEPTGNMPNKTVAVPTTVAPARPALATVRSLIDREVNSGDAVHNTAELKQSIALLSSMHFRCGLILRFRRFLTKGYVRRVEDTAAAFTTAINAMRK